MAWCAAERPTGSTRPTGTAEAGEEGARTIRPVPLEGELERPSGLGAEGAPQRRGPHVHDVGLGGQRQGHIEQEAAVSRLAAATCPLPEPMARCRTSESTHRIMVSPVA